MLKRTAYLKAELKTARRRKVLGSKLLKRPPQLPSNEGNDKKVHWDIMLAELAWMQDDFVNERKWKKRQAKALMRGVMQAHRKKALEKQRVATKRKQMQMKHSRLISRQVKGFWNKVDKIVRFKVQAHIDSTRRAAMDKRLKFIVKQTEMYTSLLSTAEGTGYSTNLPSSCIQSSGAKQREPDKLAGSIDKPQKSNELRSDNDEETFLDANSQKEEVEEDDDEDDDDYEQSDVSVDDETTLAEEEQGVGAAEYREEINALKRESEMSIEELRAMYGGSSSSSAPVSSLTPSSSSSSAVGVANDADDGDDKRQVDGGDNNENDDADDDDYEQSDVSVDDETTLAEEEQGVGAAEYREEINALKRESEMSIEDLRAMYGGSSSFSAPSSMNQNSAITNLPGNVDSEISDDDYELSDVSVDDETTLVEEERNTSVLDCKHELNALKRESEVSIEELRAMYTGNAEALNTKRPRLSSRDAQDIDQRMLNASKHGMPFLMNASLRLREYQKEGVNWLVSMCNRKLNGILADEMGLGKTVQTISMLSHIACENGIWGPHLIIVPTSVLLNWEMEFKKFCPALKVMTYYGSAKQRKQKRKGWTSPHAFHVCITSYQLAVVDANVFRRKQWYYMILDEAQNIKNFKSQRWNTLLHFNTQRRLLLTGTPLQNSMMELWSLLHFLMPHVFDSMSEFKYWFSNPLTNMVEGKEGENSANAMIIKRLHGVIRPFILRRLKKDVAKQLPSKIEHIVPTHLSRRQKFLYEDFMSRSSTRAKLAKGGYMGQMSVLMSLRKVCNHPDLFEERPIISPFAMAGISQRFPSIVQICGAFRRVTELNDTSILSFNLPCLCISSSSYEPSIWSTHRSVSLSTPSARILSESAGLYTFQTRTALDSVESKEMSLSSSDSKAKSIKAVQLAFQQDKADRSLRAAQLMRINEFRRDQRVSAVWCPIYDEELRKSIKVYKSEVDFAISASKHPNRYFDYTDTILQLVRYHADRIGVWEDRLRRFTLAIPAASAPRPRAHVAILKPWIKLRREKMSNTLSRRYHRDEIQRRCYEFNIRHRVFFPDKWLVQYDCGKLQTLAKLLTKLKAGGHRCLIFTQMTKMLNVLERFMCLHGHTYYRLDGATNVEKRQQMTDRFNRDEKIFSFILSTRSGGLGINLVGADSVIFYDTDWNPAMDAQAQDRAHRIGQTRNVHIYRLVTEHTIEENILTKANQKRQMNMLAIEVSRIFSRVVSFRI